MKTNLVKQRIREGKIALYCYVDLPDPTMVEILGMAGFDAVVFDMKHHPYDMGLIGQMVRAAEVAGTTSVVRITRGTWSVVLPFLDLGAQGIQVTGHVP